MITRPFLLHALSPLHAGTGHAADVIDLPTARYKATGIPFVHPDHVGLAYDAWAPVGDDGKVPDEERFEWLSKLTAIAVPRDDSRSFERWKKSFSAAPSLWSRR